MSWIKGEDRKEQKYFNYLERLRQSGATNMWGAAPYLQQSFRIKFDDAIEILAKWMKLHNEKEGKIITEEEAAKFASK